MTFIQKKIQEKCASARKKSLMILGLAVAKNSYYNIIGRRLIYDGNKHVHTQPGAYINLIKELRKNTNFTLI